MQVLSSPMWSMGKETNKVILNYLRHILGVHKKTTNIAVFAETGKYPIAMKIFVHIMKYWIRLHTTDNTLLLEAKNSNLEQDRFNKQSWTRIVGYLTRITNTGAYPINNTKNNNQMIKTFKQNLLRTFENWWLTQTTKEGKLDYYFSFKKTFAFEKYLDTTPRNTRMYITRLRTSSHNLPVETLRYSKKKPKREDRKCNICNLNELGNENHFLLRCGNSELVNIRKNFLANIRSEFPQMATFSDQNIIQYCLCMADINIHLPMATYAKQILQTYKSESEEKTPQPVIHTRSGRLVKKRSILNL